MADLDMYSERVADASALIREFTKTEYYHYFQGDPAQALRAFVAMLDQAEEKGRQEQAARIAELEAKLAEVRIWKPLNDVQWMNIVNHDHAYFGWYPEDAVHHAVRATEAKLAELNSMAAQAPVREVPLPAAPAPSEVL